MTNYTEDVLFWESIMGRYILLACGIQWQRSRMRMSFVIATVAWSRIRLRIPSMQLGLADVMFASDIMIQQVLVILGEWH